MTRNRLAALAFAVLLGAAACSGGSSEDAKDTSTTTTEADSGSTTTSPTTRPRGFGANRPGAAPEGEAEDPADIPEVNESFAPNAQLPQSESVVPMFEG
jgi:hypothetical protein